MDEGSDLNGKRPTSIKVLKPEKLLSTKSKMNPINTINNVNPTGGIFTEYSPETRMSARLGENITTLDKTLNVKPDSKITIYRGTVMNQNKINAGDFVTTNKQLAKDYAGTGKVIEMVVKASDLLDNIDEPLGEEYIFRPQKNQQ